ncbi:MAG: hypothetical protein AB1352_02250 [Patescibacteria group bacterium]
MSEFFKKLIQWKTGEQCKNPDEDKSPQNDAEEPKTKAPQDEPKPDEQREQVKKNNYSDGKGEPGAHFWKR